MSSPPRVLLIYKPDDDDDDDLVVKTVTALGFRAAQRGEMNQQPEFHWLGFEWMGPDVPNEFAIVSQVKAAIPAAFADACVIFNANPDAGLKATKLTFKDGKFSEIHH